jgi:hypothetical protein
MDNVILAGYPYEFVGILYFVFYLLMGRKRYEGVYTLRSRILTLLAAIAMVGCVPFHYAAQQLGIVGMFAMAIIAMISTVRDTATARKRIELARKAATPPAKAKPTRT